MIVPAVRNGKVLGLPQNIVSVERYREVVDSLRNGSIEHAL